MSAVEIRRSLTRKHGGGRPTSDHDRRGRLLSPSTQRAPWSGGLACRFLRLAVLQLMPRVHGLWERLETDILARARTVQHFLAGDGLDYMRLELGSADHSSLFQKFAGRPASVFVETPKRSESRCLLHICRKAMGLLPVAYAGERIDCINIQKATLFNFSASSLTHSKGHFFTRIPAHSLLLPTPKGSRRLPNDLFSRAGGGRR